MSSWADAARGRDVRGGGSGAGAAAGGELEWPSIDGGDGAPRAEQRATMHGELADEVESLEAMYLDDFARLPDIWGCPAVAVRLRGVADMGSGLVEPGSAQQATAATVALWFPKEYPHAKS